MALGKLASAMSVANEQVPLYVTPDATMTVATIAICNKGNEDAACSIAVCTGEEVQPSDWIEYGLVLRASEGLERASIMMGAGNRFVVLSDKATLAINIFGWERPVT